MPYPCSLLTVHNDTKREWFLCAVGRGNIASKADVIAIIKSVIVLLVLLGHVSPLAAAPKETALVQFDIPRQSADDSLPAFGQQADITVMYPFEEANKNITNRLHGEYTRKEGIHILLKGSGLYATFNADGHLIISSDKFHGESMMKSKKNMLAAVVSFFVGAGGAQHVAAVDADEGGSLLLEEVIVTAQKREQSAQEVGITLSAFSGDSIQKFGMDTGDDIAQMTPGLIVSGSAAGESAQNYSMRGVGLNDFATNNSSPVAVHLDEVFLPSMNYLNL